MILGFYALMFVALGIWGLWLFMKWRELPDFANAVYISMRDKGLLSDRIDRESFAESFIRCEAPLAATYRWGAALFCLLALPPLIAGFNWIWTFFWRLGGAQPGPFEQGYMLQIFMTFLFVMGVIVGVLYLVTAYYYRNAPPTLKSEIRRLEGQTS
ncbi:hypothetical protein [Henriciella aquimarina]|uniref:hypothetical protein n=1 Tax=Henriciella aquimarina TaxID=545261 RepID=UPI0009FCB6C6|nr:hypothetical protein [Henriciella aquimarina]